MAPKKTITPAQTSDDIKIVRTYRIKPKTFKDADALSNQKYGKGLGGIIEQLVENHFGLNPKRK
jgi:hypothetical protein